MWEADLPRSFATVTKYGNDNIKLVNTESWDREGGESAAFKNVGNHIATMTNGSEGIAERLMLKLIVQESV
jgi:hypothetical protein